MKTLWWAASAVLLVACGGVTETGDGGSDAEGDTRADDVLDVRAPDVEAPDVETPDSGPGTGTPPPPPIDGGAPTTNVYTFALETVFLGETDRGGTPSSAAWKNFGYNLDGKVTDATSSNVCTLAPGAPKFVQVDGQNGIDNSWGANMLPILQSAGSIANPSQLETQYVDQGAWTLQLQVAGLSDNAQQSANGLSAQLFEGAPYPNGAPAFDASTDWPVASASLKDGQTIGGGATVKFANAYVSGGTFVSGPSPNAITFELSLNGVSWPLTIHAPVVTFDHTAPADAMNGTIAGVLDTEQFIAALRAIAGRISLSLCGSAFDGIAQQLRQASDLLPDATNPPNVACSAISVGIGFNAKRIANPTKVTQSPSPPPDPCGD